MNHEQPKNLMADDKTRASLLSRVPELPMINLKDRALCDLEQLLLGGFHPLNGFMTHEEYLSVVDTVRLPDGSVWSMPITLDVAHAPPIGSEVVLADKYGNPVALMTVSSVYAPDKHHEAKMVYGTLDEMHPGVRYLLRETESTYIGGTVVGLTLPTHYDFKELRKSPEELRAHFKALGATVVIAFQTRNPIHRAHFELMQNAAKKYNGHILIHPIVGLTKEGDIDYITRVRAYKRLHEARMKDFATLSLLEVAMRMAGPREALWHALIRRNYGATHFIIGRDHAGPGNDSSGKPFYGPYEAQTFAKQYESEIGITLVTSDEMAYVEEEGKYLQLSEIPEGKTVKKISGTDFRRMLRSNETVPDWFSFPEVIEELRKGVERTKPGMTLFFTGLSGAGKSTIAHIVYTRLLELQDRKITLLDGDVVRLNLSKGLGFSREDRDANIARIGFVSNEITKHGGIAICCAIAPYEEARKDNRALISRNGAYVEIYVATPLEVCKQRDTKALYKKAEAGLLKNFTGVDDPYEVPEQPEITIDTSEGSAWDAAEHVIHYLETNKLL